MAKKTNTSGDQHTSRKRAADAPVQGDVPQPATEDTRREETDYEAQIEGLKAELEATIQKMDAQKDQFMRTVAEFDNYRKRTQRESERIGTDTRAAVLKSFLSALDNFKRVTDHPDIDDETYRKGAQMSIKSFMDVLAEYEVEEIEAQGCVFDPEIHYAVSQTIDETVGENVIVQILQKGYRIGDIILRPAMVTVANC